MSDQGREWAEKLAEIIQRTSADILDDVFDSYGNFDILLK